MRVISLISTCIILLLGSAFLKESEIRYCGRTFLERRVKVFLKDEGIAATMMELRDKKTNKIAFGYFVSTIRNDTNFIYSRISQINDTIVNKTYRDHKITRGTDSVITKLLCSPKALRLYSTQRFWNGNKVEDTVLNVTIVKY